MSFRAIVCSLLFAAIFALTAQEATAQERVRYDGWQLIRAEITSWDQIDLIHDLGGLLAPDREGLGQVEYFVPPTAADVLTNNKVPFSVIIEDIQPAIDEEYNRLSAVRSIDPRGGGWYDDYKDNAALLAKWQAMVADRPDLCSLTVIGTSHENRDIYALHITGPGTNKPAVLYNSCQHAREWISPMTTTYIAERLVYDYDTDTRIQEVVDAVEFIFVPVVNPDGFQYSWDTARLWRKNRAINDGSDCIGVDLNRNWDAGWGGPGASDDPCEITYFGPGPMSEPETTALGDYMTANPNIISSIDFHSYSELLLSPYGYTFDLPIDHDIFLFLNQSMADAIFDVHGVEYEHGPIAPTIYVASGGATDWCYDTLDLFAFTIELRPSSSAGGGFQLPPDQILPTCEENLQAALFLAEWTAEQQGVRFRFPNELPTIQDPGVALTFEFEILEMADTIATGSPLLYHRVNGEAFSSYPLTHVGGKVYSATLPEPDCGDVVEYYLSAAGTIGGAITSPETAPAETYTVTVGSLVAAVSYDFETGADDWRVEDDPNLVEGAWEVGVPVNFDRSDPPADYDGSGQCFLTENDPNDSNSDVDDGYTRLKSPSINLSGLNDARVEYALWYANYFGGSPNADLFLVHASADGTNWTEVSVFGPDTSAGWSLESFNIADHFDPIPAEIIVRFEASDFGEGSVVEAGIDAFSVYATECVSPYGDGDFDGDGDVDLVDFVEFSACFGQGLPECQPGNLAGSSEINADDFAEFFTIMTDPQ